jgi:hypothetical protein
MVNRVSKLGVEESEVVAVRVLIVLWSFVLIILRQMICEAVKTDVKEPKGLIERILGIEGMPVCEISPTIVLTTELPQSKDQLVPENPDRISLPTTSIQGALLLQAMLRLQSPHNEVVIRRLLFYLLRIFSLTMMPHVVSNSFFLKHVLLSLMMPPALE